MITGFSPHQKAPCEEIGTLNVFVKPHDIMISCKVTHTHCAVGFIDQDRRTDDPEHDMITEAIGKVNDFINDRIVVSETRAPNGNLIGSGWSPLSAVNFENPEYQKLIEDMHGTPSPNTNGLGAARSRKIDREGPEGVVF